MDLRGKTIVAEWTWTGSRFSRDVAVRVGADGRIELVGPAGPSSPHDARDPQRIDLPGCALLPGFVNAHSHAFQRGLRGTPQRFESGSGDFWTWRHTMYRLAESLAVDSFYTHSRRAFEEMLSAGITAVGEFHYLHHAGDGSVDPWVFDDAILAAARDVGIRICLIQCYYATGAIGQPLQGAQKRFGPVSRDEFLRQMDRLANKLDSRTQSLAVACHSIRAVDLPDLKYFRDFAAAHNWPFHIHVEEARKEIDDCVAVHGAGPMATLLREIRIDPRVTAIHCTHSTRQDLREYIARGGMVCLCPITEGNLSDGFPDLPFILEEDGAVCFGTDSNIRISATEELRWMEFGQRARRETRGIVTDQHGSCAAGLIEIGTRNGARSLGLSAGAIIAGNRADLVAIDVNHALMLGCEDDAIADSLLFGCGNCPISRVWVGGVECWSR